MIYWYKKKHQKSQNPWVKLTLDKRCVPLTGSSRREKLMCYEKMKSQDGGTDNEWRETWENFLGWHMWIWVTHVYASVKTQWDIMLRFVHYTTYKMSLQKRNHK